MLKVGVLDDTGGLAGGTVATPYSFTIRTVGGTDPPPSTPRYTWSIYGSQLPAGLSLNTTTGAITGTPLESGNLQVCYQIQDSAGATLTRCAGLSLSSAPGITANCYNYWLLPDAWPNQPYSFTFGGNGAGPFTWSVESSLPAGLSLSDGGVLSGTPTAPGSYSFLIRVADSSNPVNSSVRQFFVNVTSLAVTSNTTLPWTNVGTSYSQTLTAGGGTPPYTWAVVPGYLLPPGLSLTGAGVLSGTPTYAGVFNFNLTLTDSSTPPLSITRGFQLGIYPPGGAPPVVISTSADFGTYSIGPVQVELTASGGVGAYTWSLVSGTLPPGMALRPDPPSWFSPASSALSGVATTAGTYNFTLQVTSGAQTETRAFTLRITSLRFLAPLRNELPAAFVGVPYSFTFTSNASSPTWSLQTGTSLPPGLTLSAAGVLSGTPSQAGGYNVNVLVSDGTDTIGYAPGLNVSAIRITSPLTLPNFHHAAPNSSGRPPRSAISTSP